MKRILFMFFLICCRDLVGFSTISDAQYYGRTHREFPTQDLDSWIDPNYDSHYKNLVPGSLSRLASRMGFKGKGWSFTRLIQLLKKITHQREKAGFNTQVVQAIQPNAQDRFIIFGELFGAFHSLVRDLEYLRDQKIINDSFKIIKPNYYVAFMGNVIDHGPYVLETLMLVLRLMQANPKRVLYVRGVHEDNEYWHDYSLARELQVRGAYGGSSELIPFNSLFNRFFNTLPLALYITESNDNTIDVVQIGFNQYLKKDIDVQPIAGFLAQPGMSIIPMGHVKTSKKVVAVKVMITGEDRIIKSTQTKGLSFLGNHRASMLWLLFSSPIERHKQLYGFSNDAFAQLSIAKQFSDWEISLYYQMVGKKTFIKEKPLNILTGQRVKGGLSNLLLGTTIDLSKGISIQGQSIKEGIRLRLDQEQDKDKAIPRILMIDDNYVPAKTRKIVTDFIKQDINILLAPIGSPTLASYLDKIREKQVLVLFPITGAPAFRNSNLENIIHFRAAYDTEGKVMTEYALDELDTRKGALIYQDDVFGKGLLDGAREVLKARGVTNWVEIPYKRNSADFKKQVAAIIQEKPDTILFFSATVATQSLIRQLGIENVAEKKLIANSDFSEVEFKMFMKEKGLDYIYLNVVPNPKTSTLPIVVQYRKEAQKRNVPLNPFMLEAYIATDLLLHVLEKLELPITQEKVLAEFTKMKVYPYKGMMLDFNPKTHSLSNVLWLNEGKAEWKKIEPKPIALDIIKESE